MDFKSQLENLLLSRSDTYRTLSILSEYSIRVIIAIILFVIFYVLTSKALNIANSLLKKASDDSKKFIPIISAIIKTLLWLIAFTIILEVLNLSSVVTHIIAGAGIIGIIAGFAFKDVASNGFAGFLIKTQRPFTIGDWVEIDGNIGTVQDQGLVVTGIKTIQGQMAYIPNQTFFNGSFINYSTFGKYRIVIQMGVSYGDDLEVVQDVAIAAIKELPMLLQDETLDFYFTNVGSSTYNFEIRYWVRYTCRNDMLIAQSDGIKALKKAFERESINVAYNVTTLDFGGKGGINLSDTILHIENYSKDTK